MSHNLPTSDNLRKVRELDVIIGGFSDASFEIRPSPEASQQLWNADREVPPTPTAVAEKFAPLHLHNQFEELYRVLHPALVDRSDKKNASAFLQGARGSGKSLTLQLVLRALQTEIEMKKKKTQFRIVRLNGILVPGNQVAVCVQEILRQLTELAEESPITHHQQSVATEQSTAGEAPPRKKPKRSQRAKELLRLRKTRFTNQIQLLNEILQFACLDGVPILFVLDELDSFVKSTGGTNFAVSGTDIMDRQLLLYHLLDRVATDSSLVSFVGMTCHNGTMSRLEKRIRSRAEGTTRFIYFGPCSSIQEWFDIVGKKMQTKDGGEILAEWKSIVATETVAEETQREQILDSLRRSHNLGYSVRWLFRVVSTSLKLYRHDLIHDCQDGSMDGNQGSSLQSCLFQSLTSMGAPFLPSSVQRKSNAQCMMPSDIRMQTLRDLAGPQIALVLAARRILARDSHRENTAPLTLERILEEYKSFKGNSNRYSRTMLLVSFRDLLATGLVRPGTDHSGTAPFRYVMDQSFSDLTAPTAGKIELHLNIDIHREFQKVLEQKMLDCSAALQEWGRRTT